MEQRVPVPQLRQLQTQLQNNRMLYAYHPALQSAQNAAHHRYNDIIEMGKLVDSVLLELVYYGPDDLHTEYLSRRWMNQLRERI
ncbi:hypothetical protein LRS06_02675 [Hymenobacter sp. J193]|uniref:hypothetical protein n=1 Tax=Hymenobacter sp. J193 TaxID=2898429 RepID=UPI0021509BEE|nr:hypothetical protein [Hymenobacter sp. J193]MCR5886696.1 hypothetical protein [Hymenobacter sp. J193]